MDATRVRSLPGKAEILVVIPVLRQIALRIETPDWHAADRCESGIALLIHVHPGGLTDGTLRSFFQGLGQRGLCPALFRFCRLPSFKHIGNGVFRDSALLQLFLGLVRHRRASPPSATAFRSTFNHRRCRKAGARKSGTRRSPAHGGHGDFFSTAMFFSSVAISEKRRFSCSIRSNGTSVEVILYSRVYLSTLPEASVLLTYSPNGKLAFAGSGSSSTLNPSGRVISTVSLSRNGAGNS